MGIKKEIKQAEKSGGELTKKEIKQLAAQFDVPKSEIRERAANNAYVSPASSSVANQSVYSPSQTSSFDSVLNNTSSSTQVGPFDLGYASTNPLTATIDGTTTPGQVDFATLQAATGFYGKGVDKQIEEIRQAGATERQKLINENNLAVGAQEVQGKLDVQKIVNSGYREMQRIKRGSEMFSSLMGAFNF
jgi:hypothetical protein